MQYYQLVDQSSNPSGTKWEELQLPNDISVYGIATYNSGSNNANDQFYRHEKSKLANSMSAGGLTKPFLWCKGFDYSLSFLVVNHTWTTNALMNLGYDLNFQLTYCFQMNYCIWLQQFLHNISICSR